MWSQTTGKAVSGPVQGAQLDRVVTRNTTWSEWLESHPESLLLSKETGHSRNYEVNAYEYYAGTDRLMFPVNHSDNRLPVKNLVLGVEVDGIYKAYSYQVLASATSNVIEDIVNGQELRIVFNKKTNTAHVTDMQGKDYLSTTMYWFAWSAFHQDTELYGLPKSLQTTLSMTLGML